MPRPAPRIHHKLRELWRKANSQDQGLRITFPDAATAQRMRFAFYDAVRDKERSDDALNMAVAECQLIIPKEEPTTLWIRPRRADPGLQLIEELFPGEARTTIDHAAQESQARLLAKLQAEGIPVDSSESEPADPLAEADPELAAQLRKYGFGQK